MNYLLRHVSIRVPWHDTGWDGRVCKAPRLNGACFKLKRIAENRVDEAEEAVRGQSLRDLPEEKWPACVAERVGFMAPHEFRDEYGVVHIGQRELAGEAWQHGPVILSWDDIEEDLAYPGEDANVVIHELAHKLDMLDGSPNGLPPLPRDMPLADWTGAFEAAHADLRARVERVEWTTLDP